MDNTREMAIRLCGMVERMAEQLANDCEQFGRLASRSLSRRVWRDHAAEWRKHAKDLADIRAGLEVGK